MNLRSNFSWIFCMAVVSNLLSFGSCHLFPIAARIQLPGTPLPPGSLWPLPQSQTSSLQLVSLASKNNFKYSINIPNCKPLNHAITKRYNYNLVFHENVQVDESFPILSTVEIKIPNLLEQNLCNEFPKLSEDVNYEKYNVSIFIHNENEAKAIIEADTVWGALRGLETFTQLIWERNDEKSYFYANITQVIDWPRFPHRGLLLDTARHFISPDVILQLLDGMAYNKLNVLHWHIVDDQSFPFVSKKFPTLSQKGAFIPGVLEYSPELVQQIMEEARLRGIRVILEFDTPGHTLGFGRAFPELLTPCYGDGVNPGTPNYGTIENGYVGHGPYEILDPTKNFTYEFMKEFFTEIVQDVSQDEYIHLGMDEVYYHCWNSSPEIKEFMAIYGYENYSEVQQHFTEIHLEMVKELGAKRIVWQDPLDFGVELDKDVVVQIWKEDWHDAFLNALDLGHKVILSACWYLNYINYGESWRAYYACDPVLSLPNNGSDVPEEQLKQILGGEAAMWSEYVDNSNILPRFFPFIGAVAEKLWSPMNSSSANDAMWRLEEQRCRMRWRGLPAQPIYMGYCSSKEFRPLPTDDDANNGSGSSILSCWNMILVTTILSTLKLLLF